MLPNAVVIVICLSFAVAMGSSGREQAGKKPEPAIKEQPSMSIESAQQELTGRVMALPGVVGIAIGECDGKPCIKVLVAQKTEKLEAEIPSAYEGYRVVIDETGEIRPRKPGSI